MKKVLLPALLAAAVPALAQDSGQTISPEALGPVSAKRYEISTRLGVMGEREDTFKLGPALQLEGRAALGDTPFDIVARGYFGTSEAKNVKRYEDFSGVYYGIPMSVGEEDTLKGGDISVFGGSLQGQFNFNRGAEINPYVAAGAAFEKAKYDDIEITARAQASAVSGRRWVTAWEEETSKDSWSEDGVAFVGRVGCEFNMAPFWFVAEASWMSGLYDEDDASSDDAQFELAGRAGWQFNENCRLDAGVDYYTEWKQFFAGLGVTFSL